MLQELGILKQQRFYQRLHAFAIIFLVKNIHKHFVVNSNFYYMYA